MARLLVEGLPAGDAGRSLVRLNHAHRDGIARYGIVSLSNNANGASLEVLLLGHNRDDAIFMAYDIRTALGIDKGGELDFSIKDAGVYGKLRWYLGSPDPAVHLPAWIAVIGLGLAILGVILPFVLA